jgi:hypothetical protein
MIFFRFSSGNKDDLKVFNDYYLQPGNGTVFDI